MIAIIGRGNVATHLLNALKSKHEIRMVNPHTLEDFPKEADIVLISVTDKAIPEIMERLPRVNGIVAHTAGSVPMETIKGKSINYGVFYPLQTFSKDISLDYSKIPVFIEGSSPETVETLKKLAQSFSSDVREADSNDRKKLHLASVFACNFTNALAAVAENILKNSGIDFSVILPLMHQTVEKLHKLPPSLAQTGPAVRGDFTVMNEHLDMLKNSPHLKHLYQNLSEIIINNSTFACCKL